MLPHFQPLMQKEIRNRKSWKFYTFYSLLADSWNLAIKFSQVKGKALSPCQILMLQISVLLLWMLTKHKTFLDPVLRKVLIMSLAAICTSLPLSQFLWAGLLLPTGRCSMVCRSQCHGQGALHKYSGSSTYVRFTRGCFVRMHTHHITVT